MSIAALHYSFLCFSSRNKVQAKSPTTQLLGEEASIHSYGRMTFLRESTMAQPPINSINWQTTLTSIGSSNDCSQSTLPGRFHVKTCNAAWRTFGPHGKISRLSLNCCCVNYTANVSNSNCSLSWIILHNQDQHYAKNLVFILTYLYKQEQAPRQ